MIKDFDVFGSLKLNDKEMKFNSVEDLMKIIEDNDLTDLFQEESDKCEEDCCQCDGKCCEKYKTCKNDLKNNELQFPFLDQLLTDSCDFLTTENIDSEDEDALQKLNDSLYNISKENSKKINEIPIIKLEQILTDLTRVEVAIETKLNSFAKLKDSNKKRIQSYQADIDNYRKLIKSYTETITKFENKLKSEKYAIQLLENLKKFYEDEVLLIYSKLHDKNKKARDLSDGVKADFKVKEPQKEQTFQVKNSDVSIDESIDTIFNNVLNELMPNKEETKSREDKSENIDDVLKGLKNSFEEILKGLK